MKPLCLRLLLAGSNVFLLFLDLEKAYDTAWRYGVLRRLHNLGEKGRMFSAIASYLESRTFRLKLAAVLSREFRDN